MVEAESSVALIWTDAQRTALWRRVVGLVEGAAVRAVGGPRRSDAVELAEALGVEPWDDLRRMLIECGGRTLLLATTQGVRRSDLELASEEGIDVLTLEPIAGGPTEVLPAGGKRPGAGRLMQAPLMRFSPGYLAAADPVEALGPVSSLSVVSVGPPEALSLFARLADAVDLVMALAGVPDQVDAVVCGALREPPEELRGLAGHLTANLHIAGESGVTLHLADRAPARQRQATAIGRDGMLLLSDAGYRLFSGDNAPLDAADVHADAAEGLAGLIAHQWRWLAAGRQAAPVDRRRVIACCQAILLAARTGQTEYTEKLMRMTP